MFGFRVYPDTFSLWMLGWPWPCSPSPFGSSQFHQAAHRWQEPARETQDAGAAWCSTTKWLCPFEASKTGWNWPFGTWWFNDLSKEIYFGEFPQDFQTTPSPRGAAPLPSWRLQALHGSSRPGRQSSEKATSLSRFVQDSTPIIQWIL